MKNDILLHKDFIGDSVALISGMILTLAFAPFGLFPLAVVTPALLLATCLNTSPKRSFRRGWLFGVGLFSTGVYWVYISIHTYGNTSAFLAGLITVSFIAILAIFPGLNMYLLNRYFPKNNVAKVIIAFPMIWVFLEWVRSFVLTGFPWLLLGSSQTSSPLKGYAAIFSVYGVSLAVVLSSGLLVYAYLHFKNFKKKYLHLSLSLFAIVVIGCVGGGLTYIPWTKPLGQPISVSLVQGNIAQNLKWSADQIQPTLDKYEKLTREHWDSKIIIWPEAAVPVSMLNAMPYLFNIEKQANQHNSTVITGIPIKLPENGYLNAVITLGKGRGIYAKQRLVPFGEYVPFDKYLGRLLQFMDIPMSEFIPGHEEVEAIQVDGIKIATFICYEVAFPELVLFRDNHISVLLTVSNDAWFGESLAQAQHLQMAQMRALELARPLLFVSNDGITAIINSHGNIVKSAPTHEEFVLTGTVQPMKGITIWQKYSMDPVLIVLLGMLYLAIRRRKKEL